MKEVWLIRHGQHDWIGKALVGRKSGISLNAWGCSQASAIVDRLRHVPLAAIYSSPQQRALETALPLAGSKRLPISIHRGVEEIDFGDWTGATFQELNEDPRWHDWNRERAIGMTPRGETMRNVQDRALAAIAEIAGDEPVAVVSHGDVIKAVLAKYLGRSLDELALIDFEPGAMARLHWNDGSQPLVEFHEPTPSACVA